VRTPQFSVFIATSLDGFIARPDGGLDWLEVVQAEGEDYGYAEFFSSVDALLLGSRTYETVLGFPQWPYGEKPCYVATGRPRVAVGTEVFVDGPPEELARELADRGHRRVYLDGGQLIRSFLGAGLVDDLTISVVPVLLGEGLPLFQGTSVAGAPPRWTLGEARAYPTGLVRLRYEVSP
jgi:dihydrofolate reductase